MKTYKIIKLSTKWSTSTLTAEVEQILNANTIDGYEIVTVSFGINMWCMPTAHITICR